MYFSMCFEIMNMSDCGVWEFERNVRFTDRLLLGSFTQKLFTQITRISHNTFKFLCDMSGPYLQRRNTHMRDAISIESKVVMSLQRLGTRNTLYIVGDVYGMTKSTITETVRNFCRSVRVYL